MAVYLGAGAVKAAVPARFVFKRTLEGALLMKQFAIRALCKHPRTAYKLFHD